MKLQLHAPLPTGLVWQHDAPQAVIGNPSARKGGRVRLPNAGPFPAHFLRFGATSPQFFHQNLLAATEVPLVWKHPATGQCTAGVAEAWAVQGNSVWFRLNKTATYNNGRQVRACDYLLAVLLQAEQRCAEFEALSAQVCEISTCGGHILMVTFREKPDVLLAGQLLHAAEPGFYTGFGSRFRETYAQRIPPATGAYRVSKVVQGRLIELQRVSNWWGYALPAYRHRFNADTIEYHFLSSEAQVWEFLLRGKLDAVQTRNIAAWQEYLPGNEQLNQLVYDAEYPLPPYGIALNAATLPHRELRRGLLYAMDMDTVVQRMFRGDGQRLRTFHSGFGSLTPTDTPEYRYSPDKARACFARAGYTERGSDGILQQRDGSRLSVRLLFSPSEKINSMVNTLIQSAAACGAEIVAEPVPWQTCQRQLLDKRHEMVFWAVPMPEFPAPARLLSPDSSESPFALHAPDMQEALQFFETGQNPAAALALIDRLVYEHAIWLPGWKENRVYTAHWPRLHIPPSPWCFDVMDAHLFWIDDAE